MDSNEYLDFDEAVSFLKTTPSTLYKWLQAGKIPGHKLGRQWRFLKDELDIHVSGKGTKINIQKDFLTLIELINSRSKTKENFVEIDTNSIPEKIIWDAYDHGSRLVHIYPSKGKFEISYRTRKGMEKLSTIQEDSFKELDNSLTNISAPIDDQSLRRLYLHRGDDDVLQIRYQKIETVTGPRVTLRLWQPEKDVLPLEKISGDKDVVANFRSWLTSTHGFILVSGATGSGKTTTVYSLINEFKNRGQVVFTIEDCAELIIEGVNQIEMKGKVQTDFEDVFEKVYSSDPDVICLGLGSYLGNEEKIFGCAYKAASTGHLVIIQMDQPSCKEAVEMFKKHVKYPVDHLICGVSTQRLVENNGKVEAVYEFLNQTKAGGG